MNIANGSKRIKIETVTNGIMAINASDDEAPVANKRIEEELMLMNGKFDFVCNEIHDLRKDHATLRGDLRALINMHSETNVLLRELITKVSPIPNHSMSSMPSMPSMYPGQLVDSQSHLRPPAYTTLHMQPSQLSLPPSSSAIYSPRAIESQQSQTQIQAQPQQQQQQQHQQQPNQRIPYPVRVSQTAGRSQLASSAIPNPGRKSADRVVILDAEESEEENLLEPQINTVSTTVEELSIMDINLSDDHFFNRVSAQISHYIISSGIKRNRYLIEILDSIMSRELQGKYVWSYKTKGSKLQFDKHPSLIALIHKVASDCDPNYDPEEGQRKIKIRFLCGDRTSS